MAEKRISSSTPSHLKGFRTIDEWVEDACHHNSRKSSISVINHKSPQRYQQRENMRGSTEVELLNTPIIAPRYGEHGDCYALNKRYSSMEAEGCDSRSIGSQNRFCNPHFGEQRAFRDHHLEQLYQRTQGAVGQYSNLQFRNEFDRLLVDQHQTEQLHTNLDFWTKVELLNAPSYRDFCGVQYRRANEQMDQRPGLYGKPEHDQQRKINFPTMGVPNYQDFGQSYDQGYNSKIYPFTDQRNNFSNDIKAPTQEFRERYDRPKAQDGPFRDQPTNVSLPNPMSTNQTSKLQMEANNDIMTKLVSRQILGKDLPDFYGEISKWLSFLDHYNDTTKACQFTDQENIMRLRKCLKGKARGCVESLLVSSTNAKTVMSVLERRFGRPEDIVKSEIKKVKAIPSPKEDNPQSIIEFATAVQNLVVTLETLKKSNDLRNPTLLDELQDKLPPTFNLLWSEYIVDRKEELTLRVLADWLDRRAEAASRRTTVDIYRAESTSKSKFKARINTVNTTSDETSNSNSCLSCNGSCKALESCQTFQNLDVHKRWEVAKKNKLCFFCLTTNHGFKDCEKKAECKIGGCKRFHHKLLHTLGTKVGIIKVNFKPHITKLRIVPVILFGKSTEIRSFALLDPGSTSTLMSDRLSNLLNMDGPNTHLLLEWMNGDMAVENDSKIVNTKIQGTYDGAKIYNLYNVRTVKNLPLHKQTINKETLVKKWPYLGTVDFEGYENAQPELLIGENNGLLTATRQLVHDKWNTPIASKTWLGWVISGNEGKSLDPPVVKVFTAHEVEQDNLHELVKSSFSLDEAGVSNGKLSKSKEDERAMKLLEKYSTVNDNRWETGLLWRDEQVILPESRKNAFLRLLILEKKIG